MNSIESNKIKRDLLFFTKTVRGVYDLSSCGMGSYRHSFLKLMHNQPLDEADNENLTTYKSNYLSYPYIYGWQKPEDFFGRFGPQNISLYTNHHLQLLVGTNSKYQDTRWSCAESVLALMGYDGQISPEDRQGAISTFVIAHINENDLQKFWTDFDFRLLQGSHQVPLQHAALYKLGSMLAVTEQILYDAAASGTPIAATYRRKEQKLAQNWQKYFGEDVPTIGELVEQTVSTFRQFADPEDELTRHLLEADFNPSQFLS